MMLSRALRVLSLICRHSSLPHLASPGSPGDPNWPLKVSPRTARAWYSQGNRRRPRPDRPFDLRVMAARFSCTGAGGRDAHARECQTAALGDARASPSWAWRVQGTRAAVGAIRGAGARGSTDPASAVPARSNHAVLRGRDRVAGAPPPGLGIDARDRHAPRVRRGKTSQAGHEARLRPTSQADRRGRGLEPPTARGLL